MLVLIADQWCDGASSTGSKDPYLLDIVLPAKITYSRPKLIEHPVDANKYPQQPG